MCWLRPVLIVFCCSVFICSLGCATSPQDIRIRGAQKDARTPIFQEDASIPSDASRDRPWTQEPTDAGQTTRPCGEMHAGDTLLPEEFIQSCDARLRLIHQTDGNIVLYFEANNHVLWSSQTQGNRTAKLSLLTSGELVLLGLEGNTIWQSNEQGTGAPILSVENSGNLTIKDGVLIWQTDTAFCPRPDIRLDAENLRGKKINRYTDDLLNCAEAELGFSFLLTQGSFNGTVSASAGTHNGGGVVDIRLKNCDSCSWFSESKTDNVVGALRRAGFAAWRRGTWDTLPLHIHAVAIGDTSAAPRALDQVIQYFNGTDGLNLSTPPNGNHTRDRELDRVGQPFPPWTASFR